ncbi:unnamed protein product, partial [Sphacelaria rigidula]
FHLPAGRVRFFTTCVRGSFPEDVGFRSEGHSHAEPLHESDTGGQRWEAQGGDGRGREAAGHRFLLQVRKRFRTSCHISGNSARHVRTGLGVVRGQDPLVYHRSAWTPAFPLLPRVRRLQESRQ